jgi:hypothetical protein
MYVDRRLRRMNNRPMGDFTDDDVRLLRADLQRALHSIDAWDGLRRSVHPCALPPGTALTAGFCTADGTDNAVCE